MIAYYKFNQGFVNGNNTSVTSLADASGNSYNGNLNNFTLIGTTSNWASGGGVTAGVVCGVLPAATSSISNLSICPSALPYTWNGLNFTAAGTQTKTGLTNAAGCDSTATLNLTVKSTSSSTANLTICANQLPYSWNGLSFTAAGTKTKTGLTNSANCDSSATLNLTVNAAPVINTEPTNLGVCNNGSGSFTVAATGNGTLNYLWQIMQVGTNTWVSAVGGSFVGNTYTTNTLSLTSISNAYNGAKIRCLVNDVCNQTDTSVTVVISIGSVSIITHPANATV